MFCDATRIRNSIIAAVLVALAALTPVGLPRAQAAQPPRLQEVGRLGGLARVVAAGDDQGAVGVGQTLLCVEFAASCAGRRWGNLWPMPPRWAIPISR